jgi:hypothetical protein
MTRIRDYLLTASGAISDALAQLDEGSRPDLPTSPVLLDVPWSAQWEKDAKKYRMDCGPACVEMLGEFYRGQVAGVGTDQIMQWLKGGVDKGTTKEELQRAASHFYDVNLIWHYNTGTDQLRKWINDGKPSIVLVRYGDFPMRMDRGYVDPHWMVVVGYDSYNWSGETVRRLIVHDPDWWGVAMGQGAYLPVVESVFIGMHTDYRRLALVAV